MKLLQSNRILIIHPFFWVFFAVVIIVVKLLMCGYADLQKKEAYAQGQAAILMTLPIQALGYITVRRDDI